VAVEPKAGHRIVSVTDRRTKVDFVAFISELLTGAYAKARRIHLVLDNLNTHFRKCFEDVLGKRPAAKLLRRVQFHYTPKHASWLNMAEIEIGILSRQCLNRRIKNRDSLECEVDAWQQDRNECKRTIEWRFTRQDADRKLGSHYVLNFACRCTRARASVFSRLAFNGSTSSATNCRCALARSRASASEKSRNEACPI